MKKIAQMLLSTTILFHSYGYAQNSLVQNDTIFVQCINGTDTVLRFSTINGVQVHPTTSNWSSQYPTQLCQSCDSVVISKTASTNIITYTANFTTPVAGTFTANIYVINQNPQIHAYDTTNNCTIEFSIINGFPYGINPIWSGVSGYVVNGGDYLVSQGQSSGYVYLSVNCGVKIDSIYYNSCTGTSGIADVEAENISVYPNPFTDKFTITPEVAYQLFDVVGKLVYDSKEKEFPSDLPRGCYVLKSALFNKIVVKQ